MGRLKERLFDEVSDNGISIQDADEDGVHIKENANTRHKVYLYYSEIPDFVKRLKLKYEENLKRCNPTVKTDPSGNRPRARELRQMQTSNKNVSNKEA